MNAAEHDRNHELLCAWILGEASADEAREVEQALAASPALRAERERLEQTIHLVQDSYSGAAQLSEEAMASLLTAAAAPSRGSSRAAESETPNRSRAHGLAWYRNPGLRAAAAVTVLLGGVLGILNIDGGSSPAEDTTARVPGRPEEQNSFGRSSLGALDAPTSASPAGEPEFGQAPLVDLEDPLETFEEQAAGEGPAELEAEDLLAGEFQYGGGKRSALENLPQDAKEDASREVAGSAAAPEPAEVPWSTEIGRGLFSAEKRARDLERSVERAKDLSAQAAEIRAGRPTAGENSEVLRAQTSPTQEGDRDEAREKREARKLNLLQNGDPIGSDKTIEDLLKAGVIDQQTVDELLEGSRRAMRRGATGATGAPGPASPSTPGAPSRSGGAHKAPGASLSPPASKSKTRARGQVLGLRSVAPGAGGRGETLGDDLFAKDIDVEIGGRTLESGELEALLSGDYFRTGGEDLRLKSKDRQAYGDGRYRFQRKLTDEELRRLAGLYAERRFQNCRRRPEESPRDMYFRYWGDNPFEFTAKDPLSTFSVDVDTASYTLARRYLQEGHLPTREQIRTEEFLNYFDPDVPAPAEGTFAIQTELAPSLFGGTAKRWMLRVAVRGKEVSREERAPLALTFVIDTSGSMRENNRLELVKHAIRLLVGQLDARDSIAMVAYSTESRLILPMTPATERGVIESALHPLRANGSTNAEAGLKMGYAVAETALDPGVHSRVIFLSDGVANVGQTDQNRINADVARYRDLGVYLNTIGVGMNNHNDVFLEQLADKGDGICDYVDTPEAAQRAIVERFTGALIPIASDVKVQVQFDASQVASYRLLGYENRAVADADFRNDQVDAGEVGAGHQVVALYELELIAKEAAEAPLATVHLRWKAPKAARQHPLEVEVTEITAAVRFRDAVDAFAAAGPGYRQSVLVAQFAEFLRRSTHARRDSFASLEQEASKLAVELGDDDFHEFVGLVHKADLLGLTLEYSRTSELDMTIEEYKRFLYLRAQLEELQGPRDRSGLQELRDANDSLEQKIRDLIHKDLESRNG